MRGGMPTVVASAVVSVRARIGRQAVPEGAVPQGSRAKRGLE
jgi:hypothetical protein